MKEIAPGLACIQTAFVNCYFVGEPLAPWTLVDTGLPGFAGRVRDAAWQRFRRKPRAIVLTHGHFDHAGNALALAEEWRVPVYCAREEMPYLTGRSDYPPPDPTIGGFLAFASRFMPSARSICGHTFANWRGRRWRSCRTGVSCGLPAIRRDMYPFFAKAMRRWSQATLWPQQTRIRGGAR
jgi:glyoxylase-like metal-dependent hydrolase (beta-lactamase superfamily II)